MDEILPKLLGAFMHDQHVENPGMAKVMAHELKGMGFNRVSLFFEEGGGKPTPNVVMVDDYVFNGRYDYLGKYDVADTHGLLNNCYEEVI